ncbi:MAG: PilZ domain-containing protein [Pseudomonadota bacterium]
MPGSANAISQVKQRSGEHRRDRRNRTLKSAKIIFNGKRSVVDCAVRNLSAQGARLRLATVIGIPDEFELRVEGDEGSRPSRAIWKTNSEIGVTFLNQASGIHAGKGEQSSLMLD